MEVSGMCANQQWLSTPLSNKYLVSKIVRASIISQHFFPFKHVPVRNDRKMRYPYLPEM